MAPDVELAEEMQLVVLERWGVKAMSGVASWEMDGTVWIAVETDVEQASPEVGGCGGYGYGQGNCMLLNSQLTVVVGSSAAAAARRIGAKQNSSGAQ